MPAETPPRGPTAARTGVAGALFISDVHLLPEGGAGAEALSERFRDFLDEAAARALRGEIGTLYVLGDLFDRWYESGGRVPRGFERDCAAVRSAVERGLRIVVLPGNRDFLLGPVFTRATGATVAPEDVALRLGRLHVELAHGDALALGDHRYRLWKRLSRGLTFRRVVGGLPARLAERVAGLLRAGSEREKRVKPRESMRFSERALRSRVARGADVILAGHVHEPCARSIDAGAREGRLIALGSWESGRGAHAEWDGEGLRLVR